MILMQVVVPSSSVHGGISKLRYEAAYQTRSIVIRNRVGEYGVLKSGCFG
jgi:hypothetical protein